MLCEKAVNEENVMINGQQYESLGWKRVEDFLDRLWQVVLPEEASVAHEVLEVIRVPACIRPVKDGQLELDFIV